MTWRWIAARCRGSSHVASNTRLQDAAVCFVPRRRTDILAGIVSDGAGSAVLGGEGAALACRTISQLIRAHVLETDELPSADHFSAWVDRVRDRIAAAGARRQRPLGDFAATLVTAVSDGGTTVVAHIGDGAVVARRQSTQAWTALTWPESGEFASTTFFLTDDALPRLRVHACFEPIDAIALFSDGIERLCLDFLDRQPSGRFFDGLAAPLFASKGVGWNRALSERLREFLDSPAVLARTDDDKSVIVAVRE